MRRLLYNFTLLLLLLAFLTTGSGNALSYAWCFGDDGHSEIEYISVNGCSDEVAKENSVKKYNAPTLHSAGSEHCGPCLDIFTSQNDAVSFKRLDKSPPVSIYFVPSSAFSPRFVQNTQLITGNRAAQPPPRVSQTILVLSTIVLLT